MNPGPPAPEAAPARARLVTIPLSHYCEKARWALDRSGVDYVEDGHLPLLAWRASFGAGGGRTVPVLVAPDGVFADSTDIARYADRGRDALYPADPGARGEVEALEERFDRVLGPAVRRWAYHQLLPDKAKAVRMLAQGVPRWEVRVWSGLYPVVRRVIGRGLRVTPEGAARSEARLLEVFGEVDARLADGRRYLVADRFTAADLTFASLGVFVVGAPQYTYRLAEDADLSEKGRALVERLRATPAGRFVRRMFAEERARPVG